MKDGRLRSPSFLNLEERRLATMKIYEANGRKVWLNNPPEGYVEPKKAEPKKEEPEIKAKPEPANKSRKATANKSRKAGSNK